MRRAARSTSLVTALWIRSGTRPPSRFFRKLLDWTVATPIRRANTPFRVDRPAVQVWTASGCRSAPRTSRRYHPFRRHGLRCHRLWSALGPAASTRSRLEIGCPEAGKDLLRWFDQRVGDTTTEALVGSSQDAIAPLIVISRFGRFWLTLVPVRWPGSGCRRTAESERPCRFRDPRHARLAHRGAPQWRAPSLPYSDPTSRRCPPGRSTAPGGSRSRRCRSRSANTPSTTADVPTKG
jgi:hypothetical protein